MDLLRTGGGIAGADLVELEGKQLGDILIEQEVTEVAPQQPDEHHQQAEAGVVKGADLEFGSAFAEPAMNSLAEAGGGVGWRGGGRERVGRPFVDNAQGRSRRDSMPKAGSTPHFLPELGRENRAGRFILLHYNKSVIEQQARGLQFAGHGWALLGGRSAGKFTIRTRNNSVLVGIAPAVLSSRDLRKGECDDVSIQVVRQHCRDPLGL
jgi:hypothetical protein